MELDNIRTLLEVSKYRSFAKTADKLYLSTNAVKKRIDQLENDLGCQLLIRNSQGVTLTKSGEYFCSEMKKVIQKSDQICKKALDLSNNNDDYLKVGALNTFANELLIGNWGKDYSYLKASIRLRMIFYDSSSLEKKEMVKDLGKNIDLIVDSEGEFKSDKISFKKISDNLICFGLPKSFNKEKKLTDGNISMPLVVPENGISSSWDTIVQQVRELYPDMQIEQTAQYDMITLNECITDNKAILIIEPWCKIHPFLKVVPLKQQIILSYGLYFLNNDTTVKSAIENIKKKNA